MKKLSETTALEKLAHLKREFRSFIATEYEHKAKACAECDTPGACGLDAHFVNVRISRLEAVAIVNTLKAFPAHEGEKLFDKNERTVEIFRLDEESEGDCRTYACPLFDRVKGCLVHDRAKPLPCIHHACYENKEDLPPDELLDVAEAAVERLNGRVYGASGPLLPLPVAVRNAIGSS